MRKYAILPVLIFFIFIGRQPVNAQRTIDSDTLVSDFNYLVHLLEETHPDPYSGFGGRVFFHQTAQQLRAQLQQQPCTMQDFWDRIMTFLSNIQDGHTNLSDITFPNDKQRYLPIGFTCVQEGLTVREIPASHKALLGSRLLGINNKDMKTILAFTTRLQGCENLYGVYYALSNRIRSSQFIRRLCPEATDSVTFSLQTPNGQTITLKLPFIDYSDKSQWMNMSTVSSLNTVPQTHMAYNFLDAEKQVMYLKLHEINARDNIEFMYENRWNYYYSLADYYNRHLKQPVPDDTLAAIRKLPSYTRVFADMLRSMEKSRTSNLIIDLRNNHGGWTPITLPTLYLLFGDDYLRMDMSTQYYKRLSPLYLKKINQSLETFNAANGTHYALGDYMFDDGYQNHTPTDMQEARRTFIDNCISSDKKILRILKGEPLYRPENIYVLTNAGTFSAAFHYAFYLWKMGATVIGIPCRQAPNTYMEQTSFELPGTHLKGSISNAVQIFLPGNDPRAKTFYPDISLSYNDYKKYRFDAQAEVMFVLDYIKRTARQ